MELFVALFLVSLLMVFVVWANLFVKKVIIDWEDENALAEDGRFIINTIVNDLKKTTELKLDGNDGILLVKQNTDTVHYLNTTGGLTKNGTRLNSAAVICDSLRLETKTFDKIQTDSMLISGNYLIADKLTLVRLWLTSKNDQESFETSVRLMNENFVY